MNTINAIKIYKIANKKKAQVHFGAQAGGKWHFAVGNFTIITKVRGGNVVARKIGEVLHASWLAHQTITDEAREQINKLLNVHNLKDYVPPAVERGCFFNV
jgi:hypothetical protein